MTVARTQLDTSLYLWYDCLFHFPLILLLFGVAHLLKTCLCVSSWDLTLIEEPILQGSTHLFRGVSVVNDVKGSNGRQGISYLNREQCAIFGSVSFWEMIARSAHSTARLIVESQSRMQWVMTMTYIQAWSSEVGCSELRWESGERHVSGQS